MFPRYHSTCIYRSQLWSLKSIFVAVSSRRVGLLYGHLRPLDGHFGCLDSYLNFFPNNFLFFYINEYRKGYSLPLYGSQFKDFFFLRSTPPVASLKSSRKAKDWFFYHFKDFLWIFGAFFKVFLALLHN